MRSRAFLNTIIVAAGYLLSRILGLVREVVVSGRFGTDSALDAYRAAFTIPDLIYLVVAGGALGSAFIPVFAEYLTGGDADGAWRLASGVLNLALVGLVAACGLVALLAEPIVAFTVGRGFDAEQRALTAQLMRLLLIQPVLLGLGGLAKAVLESFDQFTLPAVGSNLYNLGIIAGALLLAPLLGVYGLVWGVLLGALLFLAVQLPGLWQLGARFSSSPLLLFSSSLPSDVRRVLRLLGPRLVGQSVWQINFIAMASFASTLGTGAVSANYYAFQLMVLPHGLLALSLGTVIFPRLARLYAIGDLASLRSTAVAGIRNVLFLALPASALLAVLALPLLRLLFQRGAFDAASAALTATALAPYALGLWAFAAAEIPVRAFYAMHDTRTPVAVALLAVALNIVLGWVLLRSGAGVAGLALAFSIANIFEATALLALLNRRLDGFGTGFGGAIGAMGSAALAAGSVAFGVLYASQSWLAFLSPGDTYRWPTDLLPLAAWLASASLVAILVYAAVARLFGLAELGTFQARISALLHRNNRGQS